MLECNSKIFVWLAALFLLKNLYLNLDHILYKTTKYLNSHGLFHIQDPNSHARTNFKAYLPSLFSLRAEPVASSYRKRNKKNLVVLNEILWKLLNYIFLFLYIWGFYTSMAIVFNFWKCFFVISAETANRNIQSSSFSISIFQKQSCCSFSNWRKLLFRLLLVWRLLWNSTTKLGTVCNVAPQIKWILYLSISFVYSHCLA